MVNFVLQSFGKRVWRLGQPFHRRRHNKQGCRSYPQAGFYILPLLLSWLLISTLFRLWREQRLGQYGKKEEATKQPLIPSRADTLTDTSLALQTPQKNGQGGQEGRGPAKNGVTWGPLGSGGSPKAKKGEKFRCCSLMWSVLYHVMCDTCDARMSHVIVIGCVICVVGAATLVILTTYPPSPLDCCC